MIYEEVLYITASIVLLSVGSVSKSISFSNVEPSIVECPKCDADYKSCTDEAGKAYIKAVQNAADSLKSKTSRIDYRATCEEARKIKNKAIAECTEVYNKCCLAETKAQLEKNRIKEEKQ